MGAPIGAYPVLTGRGVSAADALLIAAVFPLAAILLGVLKNRRLEPLGGLALLALGIFGPLALWTLRGRANWQAVDGRSAFVLR